MENIIEKHRYKIREQGETKIEMRITNQGTYLKAPIKLCVILNSVSF